MLRTLKLATVSCTNLGMFSPFSTLSCIKEKCKIFDGYSIDSSGSVLGYVSDIEGNLGYWNNYLKISKIIDVEYVNSKRRLALKPNCFFVYGVDSVDRGFGDLRVLHDLVN